MIAGCRLFMPDTQVLGVNVCNDESYFMEKIAALMRDMQSLTGIDTGAGGEGYQNYCMDMWDADMPCPDLKSSD